MTKITVHAGDFRKGDGEFNFGSFTLRTDKHRFFGETIALKNLESIEIATEENIKKIGGTIGWGIVGGLLLGPVGLLAGLIAGGRKKEITFVAKFKDGRKMFATTDNETFIKLKAGCF